MTCSNRSQIGRIPFSSRNLIVLLSSDIRGFIELLSTLTIRSIDLHTAGSAIDTFSSASDKVGWGNGLPRVKLVSTLWSHQFPSLSAVSLSEVLSLTISRSYDGLDILIAVLTVERTSAIVLGCRVSYLITVDKDQRGTCLFSGLLGRWSTQAVAALLGGTA
jgi:hypothetical protein